MIKITYEHWQNILSAAKEMLDYEKKHPIGSQRCKQCDVMITQREHLVIPKEFWDMRLCVDCIRTAMEDILKEEREKESKEHTQK
jgi:hypothetical protein